MDDMKRQFLFGPGAPADRDADLDDLDLEPGGGDRYERRLEVGRELIRMIDGEDPPEVWATARRLLALGLDRREVLSQLRLVVRRRVLDRPDQLDNAAMLAALTALPVPSVAELTEAYLNAVAARPGGTVDEVENAVRGRFGRERGGQESGDPFEWLLEVVGELPMADGSPIEWLPGDRVVHVLSVTEKIVLTHRLSEAEGEQGLLFAGFDLAGFGRRTVLHLVGGEPIEVFGVDDGSELDCWEGPAGWLDEFVPGALLAVRVTAAGTVTIQACTAEPTVDPQLVARLRTVYDEAVDDPWLPVSGEELILGLLVEDAATFETPQAPLSDLAGAAGLERRGAAVAHDDSVWRQDDLFGRLHRLADLLGEDRAILACRVFDSIFGEADYRSGDGPEGVDAARLALADPELGAAALDEAVPVDDPLAPELEAAARWADELVALASGPEELAVARWLAALTAERADDALAAAAHLELALEANPDFGPAVDRAAWYASDRGEGSLAARLWRSLEESRPDELAEVQAAARASARTPGRNDPCWCGSERKYKTCHSPQPAALPLPDRVGWLCRKAVSYLQRRGGEAFCDVVEAVRARAVDPDDPEDLAEALADPIVFDAVLTEGGWFEQFLGDRGVLLPDDEALLGTAWTQVLRTVYEVVSVRPGDSMIVRDLRSGEAIHVRERTLSRTVDPGLRFCGRAVPDGKGHQLIGAVIPVKVGQEAEVLDLCDEGDPFALCAWVGDLHRPPVITTREGEPLVECRTVLEIPDPETLADVLDVRYEALQGTSDAWAEMHEVGPGDEILRAVLTLDRETGRLTVETHSEVRLHRVLATLEGVGWDIDIIDESRRPLEVGEMPVPPSALPGIGGVPAALVGAAAPFLGAPAGGEDGLGVDPEAVVQIQDAIERRWLDESVPALGGVTPRQAADDPTRRDDLVRLIDSFPEPEPDSGVFGFRPDRLRTLLGLPRR